MKNKTFQKKKRCKHVAFLIFVAKDIVAQHFHLLETDVN